MFVYEDYTAVLEFDKPTQFDDSMMDLINDTRYGSRRNLDSRTDDDFRILHVQLYSEIKDEIDDNLQDWEVASMTDTRITIDLTYREPLQVSAGHDRDRLLVHVNLTEYKNKQGHKVP